MGGTQQSTPLYICCERTWIYGFDLFVGTIHRWEYFVLRVLYFVSCTAVLVHIRRNNFSNLRRNFMFSLRPSSNHPLLSQMSRSNTLSHATPYTPISSLPCCCCMIYLRRCIMYCCIHCTPPLHYTCRTKIGRRAVHNSS